MKPDIDLLVPELGEGDATSKHTRLMRQLLEQQGLSVRTIVDRQFHSPKNTVSVAKWRSFADTVILQHGIGSKVAQIILDKQIPIILNYHNITPATFIGPWDAALTYGSTWGRDQLRELAPLTRRAITDSKYNAKDLLREGIPDVAVVPVLWHLNHDHLQLTHGTQTRHSTEETIIFVGRVTPNKCHEDLIGALKLLTHHRPLCQLIFVGDPIPIRYLEALQNLVNKLNLADKVQFLGKITELELTMLYRSSDVFVCTSEHEGFGVPLIEAMSHGLPVIAYNAAAIAETVGDAGIILQDKKPITLAVAIDRVLGDSHLKQNLSQLGVDHSREYHISTTATKMWAAIRDLL